MLSRERDYSRNFNESRSWFSCHTEASVSASSPSEPTVLIMHKHKLPARHRAAHPSPRSCSSRLVARFFVAAAWLLARCVVTALPAHAPCIMLSPGAATPSLFSPWQRLTTPYVPGLPPAISLTASRRQPRSSG